MEEMCLNLAFLSDARPLLVTQPLGEPPSVTSSDMIDRLFVEGQRSSAVLTGTYTCCRLNHVITTEDGTTATIPCDKDRLRLLLQYLHGQRTASLRTKFIDDPGHKACGASFWGALMHSLKTDRNFWNFVTLMQCRDYILAETAEEPDTVDTTDTSHDELLAWLGDYGM
eukprot:856639-Prymnesium_polylepis.1